MCALSDPEPRAKTKYHSSPKISSRENDYEMKLTHWFHTATCRWCLTVVPRIAVWLRGHPRPPPCYVHGMPIRHSHGSQLLSSLDLTRSVSYRIIQGTSRPLNWGSPSGFTYSPFWKFLVGQGRDRKVCQLPLPKVGVWSVGGGHHGVNNRLGSFQASVGTQVCLSYGMLTLSCL